jgi:hypothetical protein
MDEHTGAREAVSRDLPEQVQSIGPIRSESSAPISWSRNPAVAGVLQVSFERLRICPGMFVQAQPALPNQLVGEDTPKYDAKFLGIIDGNIVLVVPDGVLGPNNGMKAGEHLVIRGFTGQYDFSFASRVLRVFDYGRNPPLAHALITYPNSVEARQVRGAMRMRTSLHAVVSPVGENRPVAVIMMDLSVAGSLVHSPLPLGVTGDQMNLAFSIEFENEKLDLVIQATICRSLKSDTDGGYATGFLFKNPATGCDSGDPRAPIELHVHSSSSS